MMRIVQVDQVSCIKIYDKMKVKNVLYFEEVKPSWRNLWTGREGGFWLVGGFSERSRIFEYTADENEIRIGDELYTKPRVELIMNNGKTEVMYCEKMDSCTSYVAWLTSKTEKMFAVIKYTER